MSHGEDIVEAVLKQLLINDNPEVAQLWIDASASVLPHSPKIIARLCEAAIQLGDREHATEYLRQLRGHVKPNPTFCLLEAHFEAYFGVPDKAIELLKEKVGL
jgi:hypothetical protein